MRIKKTTQMAPELINDIDFPWQIKWKDENGLERISKYRLFKDAKAFYSTLSYQPEPHKRPVNCPNPSYAYGGTLPEANPFAEATKKIADSLTQVLTEKNKRYGNSALNPLNVFTGKSKVGQRADDKLSRIQNSPELRKNDVADLIGYLFLICHENNWTDFTDQID